MICPKCRAEMPEQATYCIQCGAALGKQRSETSSAAKGKPAREEEPHVQGGQAPGVAESQDTTRPPGQATLHGGGKDAEMGGFGFEEAPVREGRGRGLGAVRRNWRQSQPMSLEAERAQLKAREGEWVPPAGYASPMQRLGAFVVDMVLLTAGAFFLTFMAALVMPFWFDDPEFTVFFTNALPMPLGWLYYAVLESSPLQATPGKIMLGVKVTDFDGNRAGLLRTTIRHFAKILSSALFMIGFLMILFTRRRQGLHDMMSGCLVVRRAEGERLAEASGKHS